MGGGDGDEDDGVEEVDVEALRARMQRSVDHLQRELQGMQAGRATPTMLDSVSVPVDSAHAPLSSLAKVLVQGPNLLQLSVYDNAHVAAIVRAIETSDLGLQPEQAGKTVRVPVPRATQETREILAKEVKKAAEACRSA